ncbi:pancreatic lipase-related protein 2 [Folsomia candida]|uniref:Pancreatic lipase-related protein 2 n=1 Tax=Folsomia candida TaxID=158441 RepID=A0A226EZF2_FOLCA|nr:pancreatic lipase-related protein 2 [Folsomia candida]OXA62568.1 Pancreatic lipase-related protein 2 [Folsomia candida]
MSKYREVFVLVVLIVLGYSKSIDNNDVVWFPNPNGDGTLIPAHLTPSPGAQAGNPADIHFLLYTKNNKDTYDEIFADNVESIDASNFIDGAPVKLLIHGFGSNYTHSFPKNLQVDYVSDAMTETYNVILMNWSILSDSPDYFTAVANAQIASAEAAKLLKVLVDLGKTSWDKVHLIGYSLGGQVVGQIGNRIQKMAGIVNRITALDPALPLFDVAHPENRTSPDDAVFVDVIHTAANGILGYWDPLGHIDWYPNGGRYQPGCGVDPSGSCAHDRAPAMFMESVFSQLKFFGRQCEDYDLYKNGDCDSNALEEMGHHTPSFARGIYFLDSNAQRPYAQGP